jgi:hypothetical protein
MMGKIRTLLKNMYMHFRRLHTFYAVEYGDHSGPTGLKCPNCGRRKMEVERHLWFTWLTVRRSVPCIQLKYEKTQADYSLLCQCQVCGAVFSKPPIVPHANWKVS